MIHASDHDREVYETVARELRAHADRMTSSNAAGFLTDTAEIIEEALGAQPADGQRTADGRFQSLSG